MISCIIQLYLDLYFFLTHTHKQTNTHKTHIPQVITYLLHAMLNKLQCKTLQKIIMNIFAHSHTHKQKKLSMKKGAESTHWLKSRDILIF